MAFWSEKSTVDYKKKVHEVEKFTKEKKGQLLLLFSVQNHAFEVVTKISIKHKQWFKRYQSHRETTRTFIFH